MCNRLCILYPCRKIYIVRLLMSILLWPFYSKCSMNFFSVLRVTTSMVSLHSGQFPRAIKKYIFLPMKYTPDGLKFFLYG